MKIDTIHFSLLSRIAAFLLLMCSSVSAQLKPLSAREIEAQVLVCTEKIKTSREKVLPLSLVGIGAGTVASLLGNRRSNTATRFVEYLKKEKKRLEARLSSQEFFDKLRLPQLAIEDCSHFVEKLKEYSELKRGEPRWMYLSTDEFNELNSTLSRRISDLEFATKHSQLNKSNPILIGNLGSFQQRLVKMQKTLHDYHHAGPAEADAMGTKRWADWSSDLEGLAKDSKSWEEFYANQKTKAEGALGSRIKRAELHVDSAGKKVQSGNAGKVLGVVTGITSVYFAVSAIVNIFESNDDDLGQFGLSQVALGNPRGPCLAAVNRNPQARAAIDKVIQVGDLADGLKILNETQKTEKTKNANGL